MRKMIDQPCWQPVWWSFLRALKWLPKVLTSLVLAMFISLPALAAPPGAIVAPITLLLLGDDCKSVIVSLVKDINTSGVLPRFT